MKLKVLLVCGGGASSGFLAVNMRKAAKERNIDISLQARSESEVENYIDDIDALMIGPHLAYVYDELLEYNNDYPNVKIILMKPEYYSTLNGEKALDHLLEELK